MKLCRFFLLLFVSSGPALAFDGHDRPQDEVHATEETSIRVVPEEDFVGWLFGNKCRNNGQEDCTCTTKCRKYFNSCCKTSSTVLTSFFPTTSPIVFPNGDKEAGGGGSPAISIGLRFFSSQNGEISSIRYYDFGGMRVDTVNIWSATGGNDPVVSVDRDPTVVNPEGWIEVRFAPALQVIAGEDYQVTVITDRGPWTRYADSFDPASPFAGGPYGVAANNRLTVGPLTAYGRGTNGVFRRDFGGGDDFPNEVSDSGDNFLVDAVFRSCPL